jgi:hypothetical protein
VRGLDGKCNCSCIHFSFTMCGVSVPIGLVLRVLYYNMTSFQYNGGWKFSYVSIHMSFEISNGLNSIARRDLYIS